MPDQRGFTLIEVLIALAITALVAMLSFTSISTVLNSVDSLRSRGDRISELNRAWNLVNRDISQMVNRPIRNEFGEVESTLFGGEVVDSSLTFTRGGWHNPNRQLRSELQRVTYRLEGDVLWRENFVVLDRTRESEPQRARLLEGVQSFEIAFLDPRIQLQDKDIDTDDWPDNWGVNASNTEQVAPPEAFELRLTLEDWGEVRWLYEVPR